MFEFLNEEYSFSELFSGKYARFLKGGVITDSIAFKKWFGESKVIDDDGNPLIVYHGTTHAWTKYSPEKGNPNNFLGVGFYASSSKSDVERNYKGIGKDLTSRIEFLADKLTDEEINDKKLPYEKRDEVYNKKRVVAKKILVGKKQHILEVYLSMQNPLILTDDWKGTNFEFEDTYNEETEEYTPSESREKLFDIVRGLVYGKYSEHKLELHKVLEPLNDIYDTIKANDLLQKFKENYYLLDWLCCSENGEPLNMNFIRDIFIEMGFDGIIDEMPSKRFKGMNINEGTKHYIVWNSTQIKSADNKGTFDSNNPDIRYEEGGGISDDYDKVVFVNKYSDAFFDYCKKNIKKIIKTLLSEAYYNFKIYDLNIELTIDDIVNANEGRSLGEYEDETNTLRIGMWKHFTDTAFGLVGIDDLGELSKDEKELIGGAIMNILVTADNEFARNIQDSIRQVFYHEMIHHYDNIKYGKGYADSVNRLEEIKGNIKGDEKRFAYYVNMQHEVDANFVSTLARLTYNHGEGYSDFRTLEELFFDYFPRWKDLSNDNKRKVTKRLYKYFYKYFYGSNPDIRYEEGGEITTADQLIDVEPSVKFIMEELGSKGHKALIIGGAVRDALLGIEPKDIDVEVYKISYSDLSDFLAKFGRVDLVGKTFGVIKFHPRGSDMSYDFSVPRKENRIGVGHTDFKVTFDENMTIAEAGARRDFTFNAIAYDVIENKIYDYFGGLKDLGEGVIRHTSKAFTEDSLRILRAMQFQARFGFSIHPDTIALIREMLKTNDFNDLSKERVYDEWMKWAEKGIRHDLIFQFLRDTTLIDYYPELKLLKETPQDKIYHPEGDVEIHTEMTLHEMDKLIARDKIVGEEKAILVMSILLHDIAKPQCTKEEMKRERMTITSSGHESMGGKMCVDFLPRLGFPESFNVPVANLVANHLAGVSISSISNRSGQLKAVKKLSNRLHPATIRQLIYVMDADNYGRGTERKEATGKKELLELSAEADVLNKQMKAILLGRNLIELGLKPSVQFKVILDKAFEAQENGEFSDIEGGRKWLKEYLNPEQFAKGGKVKENKFMMIPNEQTPRTPKMNDVDGFIKKHSEELKDFLNFCASNYNLSGGAVAANQVSMNGKRLMYRVFALNGIISLFEKKLDNDLSWQLIINPIIDEYIGVETEKTEGCLSWEGKKINMKRSPKIKVSYYTIDGNKIEGRVFEGLVAQVWQHEIDHLNGVEMKVEEATLIESMIYKEGGSIPIKK